MLLLFAPFLKGILDVARSRAEYNSILLLLVLIASHWVHSIFTTSMIMFWSGGCVHQIFCLHICNINTVYICGALAQAQLVHSTASRKYQREGIQRCSYIYIMLSPPQSIWHIVLTATMIYTFFFVDLRFTHFLLKTFKFKEGW